MAWKWLCQLEMKYPNLASRAKAMNARDEYVMKYDPVEVKRREKEEKKRRRKEERRRVRDDEGRDMNNSKKRKSKDDDSTCSGDGESCGRNSKRTHV